MMHFDQSGFILGSEPYLPEELGVWLTKKGNTLFPNLGHFFTTASTRQDLPRKTVDLVWLSTQQMEISMDIRPS